MRLNSSIVKLLCVSCGILSSNIYATDLTVNFTANIRETTCDMRITGGTGNNQNNTIAIGNSGKTSLDKILSGDASVSVPFSLDIVTCPSSLAVIKTTITGTQSGIVPTLIINGITSTDKADYLGVSVARASGGEAFTINSTVDAKRLVWTTSEIAAKKVNLLAKLVPTDATKVTTGAFNATAIFNFTYE